MLAKLVMQQNISRTNGWSTTTRYKNIIQKIVKKRGDHMTGAFKMQCGIRDAQPK